MFDRFFEIRFFNEIDYFFEKQYNTKNNSNHKIKHIIVQKFEKMIVVEICKQINIM